MSSGILIGISVLAVLACFGSYFLGAYVECILWREGKLRVLDGVIYRRVPWNGDDWHWRRR